MAGSLRASCPRVSMAYVTSWSSQPVSQIQFNKLTHICYAFIEEKADGSLNIPAGYVNPTLVNLAHAAGTKVLVSVGGATWSGAFPALAASPTAVANFCNQVEAFLRANNFDGVDIDWEFPDDATKSNNFDNLIQALRNKFDSSPAPAPSWQITAALSADSWYESFLHPGTLKNSLTYFNLMAYDYHGPWSGHSGHNAALYQATGDPGSHPNANQSAAVNWYKAQGAPASQIVMGLPFYGYRFPTANLHQGCSCGSTTSLTYASIAPLVGAGWTYHFDTSAQSPYLTNGSEMITYDDANSIGIKADWAINTAGVAGVFMWALDQGYLGPGNEPLLNAMAAKAFSCSTPTVTLTPSATPTPVIQATWRVNAGGGAYTDSLGKAWSADMAFSGGTAASGTGSPSGPDPTLFVSERYGSAFSYAFHVPAGSYQVTLRFAEIYYSAAGQRLFNVALNGATVLSQFDIVAAAGAAWTPVDRVFANIAPSGGVITVSFSAGSADLPKVSAIEIIPMPSATATPTRTRTRSPVPTPSATPTGTGSATGTASATRTPTADPSATATPSAGRTATPTATRSASPTPSATPDAPSIPGPSPTVTNTATAALSVSASPTASPGAASATPSLTPAPMTATVTVTATGVIVSPTQTGTLSPVPASATPSATASPTPSPVAASATATLSASPTATPTPSASATWTPSPIQTASATDLPSATPTQTPSPEAPSATSTATRGLATRYGGRLEILEARAWPQPGPRWLALEMDGPADGVELRVYSAGMACVGQASLGPVSIGWNRLDLGAALEGLAPGTYFFKVEAGQSGRRSAAQRGRLVLLR